MRPKPIVSAVTLVAALLAAPAPVGAQIRDRATVLDEVPVPAEPAPQIPAAASRRGLALRGPVDDEEYVVGPGDRLSIELWGQGLLSFSVTVSLEGDIILPGIAAISAAGRTLADVKDEIGTLLGEQYRNMEFSVSLVELRTIEVNVLGNVGKPGSYAGTALDLAGELIRNAGGIGTNASERNIVIARRDGSSERVDLVRYRNTGSVSSNPPILDGDVIFVPDAVEFVYAFGPVAWPGRYELAPGETVESLIELAGGFARGAKTDTVEVRRFRGAEVTESMPVDLDRGGAGFALADGDQVYVRAYKDWRAVRRVAIEGEVVHPGTYGINEGVDRLSDVFRRAGGPTPEASLRDARLHRTRPDVDPDPELERLLTIPPGDMTETEYAYLKTRARGLEAAVVVDFEKIVAGDDKGDVLLLDGDRIVVPRLLDTVTVSGQVVRPGRVTYEPGKPFGHYVARAGGYADGARRGGLRVIRRGTGERVSGRGAGALHPGDEVWVPEKLDTDWWDTIKEIATFAASIATAYLLIDLAVNK